MQAPVQTVTPDILEKFPVGTKESYFKDELPNEELMYLNRRVSIYRVFVGSYYTGANNQFRFFYFTDGVLEQIDTGKRAADFKIKIEKS